MYIGNPHKGKVIKHYKGIPSGANKWHGAALAPNGKIYAAPYQHPSILEFDPTTKEVDFIGDFGSNGNYLGAVTGLDGHIYFIPHTFHRGVLELDPDNGETYLHTPSVPIGYGSPFAGGVLAPNGKIYFVPQNDSSILEFDTVNKTSVAIPVKSGSIKWTGGILAPNGNLYFFPFDDTEVLELNPNTHAINYFGTVSGQYPGGVIKDGIAYGAPRSPNTILKIDTSDNSIDFIGNFPGSNKFTSGCLLPNGNILFTPHNSDKILEFNPETGEVKRYGNFPSNNSHSGAILAPDGSVYLIPRSADFIAEITNVGEVTADMYTMPPLHELATSKYNMYQNKF